jgi:hypothetical protein
MYLLQKRFTFLHLPLKLGLDRHDEAVVALLQCLALDSSITSAKHYLSKVIQHTCTLLVQHVDLMLRDVLPFFSILYLFYEVLKYPKDMHKNVQITDNSN